MPAHRRTIYRITFERNGKEIDHDYAQTADRANKIALLMINKHCDVRDGDTLKVTEHR